VAKGTPYRYFVSKEALFLELLTRELGEWFEELVPQISRSRSVHPEASLPRYVSRTLLSRALLMRLLPLLHAVLERNIDVEAAVRFKRRLAVIMAPAACALEARLPGNHAGDGFSLLLRVHALAIGLLQMSRPSEAVRQALDSDPHLKPFDIDFGTEFEAALGALIRGWDARG
jgi:AcrR family transcriptional regulator